MSTHPQNPVAQPLSDAQIDRALGAHDDAILPSSGFADAVMAAVTEEAVAPAPIPFPWKRAWPLFAAAPVALAILIAACVAGSSGAGRQPAAQPEANFDFLTRMNLASILHNPADASVFWIAVSLAIALFCLLLMRRVLFSR